MDKKKQVNSPEANVATEKLTYIRGKYTDGQRVASNKYIRENYFNVKLKKSDRDNIKAAAELCGMSMAAFINDAIQRRMYDVFTAENEKQSGETSENSEV